MALTAVCLGRSRREWSLAMAAELQAIGSAHHRLSFAVGCLLAAWRQLPFHKEGRFLLASYLLAIGLLLPTASLQFMSVAALIDPVFGTADLIAVAGPSGAQKLFLAHAYPSALSVLLALRLLLGVGHLRLAWFLLERDWSRIADIAALTVAASATLLIFTGVLFLDDIGVALQAGVLSVELAAIYAYARWHSRIFTAASLPDFA